MKESTRHNPEFTMIELYEAYADYHANAVIYSNRWLILPMKMFLQKYNTMGQRLIQPRCKSVLIVDVKNTGVDFYEVKSDEEAKALAKEHGIEIKDTIVYVPISS